MGISFVRTFILYFFIIIAIRVMGKRQVGEMQPTEFVVTILISELVSIPMQDTAIPLMNGVIPILILVSFELLSSFFMMKNINFRNIFVGKPSILISKGQVMQTELEKSRCSIDELLEELRLKSVKSVEDVDFAVLETNGKISVLLKEQQLPPTREDLKVKHKDSSLPIPIIVNGRYDKNNITKKHIEKSTVDTVLRKHNVEHIRDVYLMCLYPNGDDFLIKKEVVK